MAAPVIVKAPDPDLFREQHFKGITVMATVVGGRVTHRFGFFPFVVHYNMACCLTKHFYPILAVLKREHFIFNITS